MSLTATTSAGSDSQAAAGSTLQAPAGSGGLSASQQGTSWQPASSYTDLLKGGQNVVPLANSPVTTVSLAPASQTTTQSVAPAHHTNPFMFSASVLLFLVAIVLFWAASRPAKNTTVS